MPIDNSQRWRQGLLVLFALALGWRLWFLLRYVGSPFFIPVEGGSDRWLYVSLARNVAGGTFFPDGVFQYMPLYAWWLGFWTRLAGDHVLLLSGLFGAVLDSCTALLIARTARKWGAPAWAAWGMAMLYAHYPLAIVYSATTMPNTINAFLLTWFALLASQLGRSSSWRAWLGTGVLAGITCLSFAGMLLALMVTTAAKGVAFVRKRAFDVLPRLACFFLIALLPIVPVAVHNWRAEGHFVLITAHGGFNFYLGNHAGATGYPVLLPGFRGERGNLLADALDEAQRLEGRKLAAAEFSRHWSDRAKAFLRENPGAAARLFARKVLCFFNGREYDDLRLLPMLGLTGTAFSSFAWPGFAWISIFGLAGLVAARRAGLLRLITATGCLSIILFFVTSRYRLTLCPLLCIVGAVGFQSLELFRKRGRPSRLGLWGITVAVAAVLAFWPLKGTDFRSLDHYNTAAHLMEKAMHTGEADLVEQALEHARAGIAIDPTAHHLRIVEGNALFGLARTNEARAAYAAAVRLNPKDAQGIFNLAVVMNAQGERTNAIAHAERAVALDPGFEQARKFLEGLRNGPATGPAP